MNTNITNQTSYEQIKIVYDNKEYLLKKGETVTIFITGNNSKIKVFVLEKNKVLINWLFALIDGFVDDESVVNSLYCNLSFNIEHPETNTTIVLKDLEYRDDKIGYIYDSVYVDCDENIISSLSYELTDIKNALRKSLFYYICVVSLLPVFIFLLILSLLNGDIALIFAGILVLFWFSVPCWKKAYRTKKYYNAEYAHEVLLAQFNKQKANLGSPVIPEPKGFIEKSLHKILDFIFKRNK